MGKKIPILLGLIILAFILWLQTSSIAVIHEVVGDLQNVAYDWRLQAQQFTQHKKFETSVVIIDIDDKSLAAEGRWPWERSKLADLVRKIQADGAAVVALDLIFPQKENNIATEVLDEIHKQNLDIPNLKTAFEKISPMFDNDVQLAKALSLGDSIIGFTFTADAMKEGNIKSPLVILKPEEKNIDIENAAGFMGANPILANAVKYMGFVSYFNTEGIIRKIPLVMEYNNGVYPSLALETARAYLLTDIKLVTAPYANTLKLEGIKIGGFTIPTDEKGQAFIPFRGPSFTFPYYSATDVLHHKIPPHTFEGKIVFIGTSAAGLTDLNPTAIANSFPGVEIQATITDGILKNDFWYKPAWTFGAEVIITFSLGIILVFLYPFLRPRISIILTLIITPILVYADNLLLQRTGLIVSIFFPGITPLILGIFNIIYGYLFESRHRQRLNDMFGQYVPKEHIDEMMKNSNGYGLHGETREMSVLFSDIRGFTQISEHMPAEQLKEMLNELLTPLTEAIFNKNGTIDKYIGDAIMAFWGAPLHDADHAKHALAAALDMQAALKKLEPIITKNNWPSIKIGIGINSGKMIVGDMGSKYRRNYTVLGDEVNLGSRVESLTKFYGVSSIATEEAQHNQPDFVFRLLDRICVVGKAQPTVIYEIVCYRNDITQELLKEIELSNAAIDYYFKRAWDEAEAIFAKLAKQYPQHKFYKLYLERIQYFKANPPPTDWDGTYVHTVK